MSLPESSAESLMRVTREGGGEAAIETMGRAAPLVATAVRRAIPFLGRRHIVVKPAAPTMTTSHDLGHELQKPFHVAPLAVEPGGARAALVLDARAIAFLCEGALGGDGSDLPELDAKKGLSTPQLAFVERMVDAIVYCISTSVSHGVGFGLAKLPESAGEKSAGGPMVQLPLLFEDRAEEESSEDDEFGFDDDDDDDENDKTHGTVVLAISKNALYSARATTETPRRHPHPKVVATLEEVPVTLIGELGRLSMTLAEVSALAPGDTLRLDVAVNANVNLHIGEQVLFRGQPTTAGSQLAIQVVERLEVPAQSEEAGAPTPNGKLGDAATPSPRKL